ncbi:protein-tyrosine-phosphatase [Ranunculus cassubicifolius]
MTYSSKPFNFFSDSPPKLSVSSDQFQYCSQALRSFLMVPYISLTHFRPVNLHKGRLMDNSSKGIKKRCSVAIENVISKKNRYPNILPFDESRVILKSCNGGCDYINASFMKDFWEMIIQYHCPVIVMLTRSIDNNKKEYPGDSFEYGKIRVHTKWTRPIGTSLVLRCFDVKYKELNEPVHTVIHIQYLDWPDFQVPSDTLSIREIVEMICHVPTNLGLIVVHCSAPMLGFLFCYNALIDELEKLTK